MSRSMSWTEAGERAQATLDRVLGKSHEFESALMALGRSEQYQARVGRRVEKREQTILALMDAIKAGKTVQVVSPNKEYAEALYAEAEARIRDSETE